MIWIDVEDLFFYETLKARPSGIQRLAFELYLALVGLTDGEICFVRHDPDGLGYRVTPWEQVLSLYQRMAHAPLPAAAAVATEPAEDAAEPPIRKRVVDVLRKGTAWMPPDIRAPMGEAVRAQLAALRAGARFALALARRARPASLGFGPRSEPQPSPQRGVEQDVAPPLVNVARPGDVLCIFGAPWVTEDLEERAAFMKREAGLQLALLMYDIILIVRPEYVTRSEPV